MNIQIYGNKMVFICSNGRCIINNVEEKVPVVLFATGNNTVPFHEFAIGDGHADRRRYTVKYDNIYDKNSYDELYRRGEKIDVLFADSYVYKSVNDGSICMKDLDFSFFDRLIFMAEKGINPVNQMKTVELVNEPIKDLINLEKSIKRLYGELNYHGPEAIKFNLVEKTEDSSNSSSYMDRAYTILGL